MYDDTIKTTLFLAAGNSATAEVKIAALFYVQI